MDLRKCLKLLDSLCEYPDDYAEHQAGLIANEVSDYMAQQGHAELVFAPPPAAQPIEVKRFVACCIAAVRPPADAFTPPQVAKQLGVRPASLLSWIRSGQLKAANVGNKSRPRYRIQRADIDAFLKGRQPQPRPPRTRRSKTRRY